MKKHLFLLVSVFAFLGISAQNNDPVVMTINGKDIKKSEFEYFYNKNNNETALEPKSLDEYVVLFKNFKLRVAEAESQKLDTTETFRKEFEDYRSLLAEPYLSNLKKDKAVLQNEYNCQSLFSETSHILIPFFEAEQLKPTPVFPADTLEAYKKAVQIRNRILKGESFEKMAKEYSADESSANAEPSGYMGWVSGMELIPALGQGLAETPVGKISQPIRSNFGYHLFKVNARKPNWVSTHAAHILAQAQAGNDSLDMVAKAKIDDVYNQLLAGADFATLAKEYSEDGSAENGGDLGWFDKGRMVREFEQGVYSLSDLGDISKPIRSRFGYHIIKLIETKPFPSFEEQEAAIENKMNRTGYQYEIMKPAMEELKEEYGFSLNETVYQQLLDAAQTVSPTTQEFYDLFENNKDVLFLLNDHSYTVSDFIDYMKNNKESYFLLSTEFLDFKLDGFEYAKLLETEDRNLENKYPEFRNLVREYHDGILLFEVSNKEIWERSSLDTEGLEAFFEKNKDKYTWDAPHYKGYVVYLKDAKQNKKIQKEIKNMSADDAAQYLLDNYRVGDVSYVRLEKSLFVKGENAFIDEKVFNTGKASLPEGYETFFVIGKLLDSPESYTDVRGAVITDYQDFLEKEWLKELNAKYPVILYEKVLRTVK